MVKSELEKNLEKAKEEISLAEKALNDYNVSLDQQAAYHALKSLYYQNKIIIGQNKEIINNLNTLIRKDK